MRDIIAQSINGEMEMGKQNEAILHDWLAKNPKKYIRISPEEPPTYSLRKFFEGAVVPYYFYQHNIGVYRDFRDARESLKLEFNPIWIINSKGERQQIGGSTLDKNKDWWNNEFDKNKPQGFLKKIETYFLQNGYEFPDSETYKKWYESAPFPDEIFPSLKRLIELYKKQ